MKPRFIPLVQGAVILSTTECDQEFTLHLSRHMADGTDLKFDLVIAAQSEDNYPSLISTCEPTV